MFRYLVCIVLIGASALCLAGQAQAESAPKQAANLELVDVLLKYGMHQTINQAMEEKDYEAVKLLIEHGVDLNLRGPAVTLDCLWANNGNRGETQVNSEGQTVLEIAIQRRKTSLIKLLLSYGANPHFPRNLGHIILDTPWNPENDRHPYGPVYCVRKTNKKVLLGKYWTTAVYDVIKAGDLEILAILANAGVNFNKPCGHHGSALQFALELKNKEVMQFLLDHGAKI